MSVSNSINNNIKEKTNVVCASTCYHCGEINPNNHLQFDDKFFCCQGCLTVYNLLQDAGLCSYYELNEKAGINKRLNIRSDKFAYLEDASIIQSLINFQDKN